MSDHIPNPIRNDLRVYRGDTFDFTFIIQDPDGNPADLSAYQDIRWRMFKDEEEDLFSFSTDELSISDNRITKQIPAEDMAVAKRGYWYELKFTKPGGHLTTWGAGKVTIIDAETGTHQNKHEITLQINT